MMCHIIGPGLLLLAIIILLMTLAAVKPGAPPKICCHSECHICRMPPGARPFED